MSEILLESTLPFEYRVDEKSENGKKKLYIEGIYQKSDTENENGRIYPRVILERECKGLQSIISENRLLGEMNHPQASDINPERACHLVKSLNFLDDGVVFGRRI